MISSTKSFHQTQLIVGGICAGTWGTVAQWYIGWQQAFLSLTGWVLIAIAAGLFSLALEKREEK
jgi:high-affinity Fe2+/Pb2+ permease